LQTLGRNRTIAASKDREICAKCWMKIAIDHLDGPKKNQPILSLI